MLIIHSSIVGFAIITINEEDKWKEKLRQRWKGMVSGVKVVLVKKKGENNDRSTDHAMDWIYSVCVLNACTGSGGLPQEGPCHQD